MNTSEKTPEEIAKEQEAERAAAAAAAAGAQPKPEAQPAAEPAKAAPTVVVIEEKPWYKSNVAVACYCVGIAALIGVGIYLGCNALYGNDETDNTAE